MNNFNLKRFLVENKLTVDSKIINESKFEYHVHPRDENGDHIPSKRKVVKVSRATEKSAREYMMKNYPKKDWFWELNSKEQNESVQSIRENSLADYADKWYESLLGLENLHKYPQDFIDWLNEEDTWAESYAMKYKIKNIIDLFSVWVNEKY